MEPKTLKAKIYVTLREGILDPQGKATQQSLESLGYQGVSDVRVGKFLEITLTDRTLDIAREDLNNMCEKLLSNPIIEDYSIEIEP